MVSLVIFLTGVSVGGVLVWALVSYTALNPMPSEAAEDSVPIERILARLAHEGVSTTSSRAVMAARRRDAGKSTAAVVPKRAAHSRVKGQTSHV
ncbi:hypothetical protein GPX89_07765 [Nocardia sp. ET3-3]|uniref:Uncharacterized protein n=1 Tax=Nocardia terrae TaxID=2675851 RepID=A0A7K1US28_9NOCA|nr:hypothetical protein [Nocardia terrae]MVU77144.1 hypothetical protein [Nocardia terrae]